MDQKYIGPLLLLTFLISSAGLITSIVNYTSMENLHTTMDKSVIAEDSVTFSSVNDYQIAIHSELDLAGKTAIIHYIDGQIEYQTINVGKYSGYTASVGWTKTSSIDYIVIDGVRCNRA